MTERCDAAIYDWVIVLGGTNDLPSGMFSPESIYNDLRNAWKIALDHNETAQVLALTIPECGVKSANLDKRRDTVNSFILAHKENRFHTFDLKTEFPYHSLDQKERERLWADTVHFTAEGYDRVGGLIADRLIGILSRQEQQS
ncbi:hypothetical protein VTN31DRAFT_5410 [Thermomyces dupontii]|uniref:uncharacterized protein n=1 Tax=Talaromyces thermophilus TaxID=28565 RepID=UPI00374478F8